MMADGAKPFLPYGRQSVNQSDLAAVAEVLGGDWLTAGPTVEAFESAFAAKVDAADAVSCSSGTAALHLAALGLKLGRDDWVVVPSMTFLATANAARFVGAEVQFADVDADSGLMGVAQFEAALDTADTAGRRVRAVFPVHLNGQCCDMAAIREVALERGLAVVEDGCHAIGGDGVGGCRHSDMTVFSFHPVKTITAGEGGMVTSNDSALAGRMRRLRNHGIVREPAPFAEPAQGLDKTGEANPWYYEMPEIGFNYRLSDLHAALGLSQLGRLDDFIARRRALARCYDRGLKPLEPFVRPVARTGAGEPAWHLYVVLCDFTALGAGRARLMAELRAGGIGTQVHYLPVSRQPYYRGRYGEIDLPGADAYYDRALSLPLFPAMTESDVDRVVTALTTVVEGAR